jgi:hypothetical protein
MPHPRDRKLPSAALDRLFDARRIDEDYAQALGRMVIVAGQLEFLAHRLCWTIISVEEHRGARITGPLNFGAVLDMIRSVAKATVPPDATGALHDAVKQARSAMGVRNAMLHATWVTRGSDPSRLRYRLRTLQSEPVEISNIDQGTQELREAAQRLAWVREVVLTARADVKAQGAGDDQDA